MIGIVASRPKLFTLIFGSIPRKVLPLILSNVQGEAAMRLRSVDLAVDEPGGAMRAARTRSSNLHNNVLTLSCRNLDVEFCCEPQTLQRKYADCIDRAMIRAVEPGIAKALSVASATSGGAACLRIAH